MTRANSDELFTLALASSYVQFLPRKPGPRVLCSPWRVPCPLWALSSSSEAWVGWEGARSQSQNLGSGFRSPVVFPRGVILGDCLRPLRRVEGDKRSPLGESQWQAGFCLLWFYDYIPPPSPSPGPVSGSWNPSDWVLPPLTPKKCANGGSAQTRGSARGLLQVVMASATF